MPRLNPVLIFLEASDAALVRRFSETRRPHPLALDRPVVDGIREERALLAPIRALADETVDTSDLTVHELREIFLAILARPRAARPDADHVPQLRLQARRAGRGRPRVRRPVPAEPALRAGTPRAHGEGPARSSSSWRLTGNRRLFIAKLAEFLRFVLPHYVTEGKTYLTVAIGCTGGRHRSVMIAEALRRALADVDGVRFRVRHRDIEVATE